jgi:hypothetical protein
MLMVAAMWIAVTVLAADGGVSREVGTASVTVQVGETQTVEVGNLHGLICDDLTLVQPELRGGESTNVLLLTGLKAGKTLCRAGVQKDGRFKLVHVTVIESN